MTWNSENNWEKLDHCVHIAIGGKEQGARQH